MVLIWLRGKRAKQRADQRCPKGEQRTSAATALSGREGQGWRDYFAHAAPSRDLHRRVGKGGDFGAAPGFRALNWEANFHSPEIAGEGTPHWRRSGEAMRRD